MKPRVFVFNPLAEGYIARGKGFTPVKHQAMLVEDLGALPQFLCGPEDIVLVSRRPAAAFLGSLQAAGFATPEYVELRERQIDPTCGLNQREFSELRPWAWSPDSVEILQPLFSRVSGNKRGPEHHFNEKIGQLYSKVWSANFLRKVLAHCGGDWLCSELEAGIAVDNLDDALKAVSAVRQRGHHRVVVKEAVGLAGHNAIRLWERELLPTQRQWMAHRLEEGGQLVVEPWLKREVDFSVQLEMENTGLRLIGYTGLINDLKGQFLANWAEPDFAGSPPAKLAALFAAHAESSESFPELYGEVFDLLQEELQSAGFVGPISIDALAYRTDVGEARLKPVVEINPRYTMGRLTLELMKHVLPGSWGRFRLITRARARADGFADLVRFGKDLRRQFPIVLESEGGTFPRICQGAVCLNDPSRAQVCLAVFEVGTSLNRQVEADFVENPVPAA